MRLFCTLVLLGWAFSSAQSPTPVPGVITSHPDQPRPKVADVDTLGHMLNALDQSMSGHAHQTHDWDRMRSLFLPGARLIPVSIVPGTPDQATAPATDVAFLSVDDYIAAIAPALESKGLAQHTVHTDVSRFRNILQVFSTYETRHHDTDALPFERGIRSIQLLRDGGRLWIVSILWDTETREHAIPSRYLPTGTHKTPHAARKSPTPP